MSAVNDFVNERSAILRPGIDNQDALELKSRVPDFWANAGFLFEKFDGELHRGALFPGMYLANAQVVIESVDTITALIHDDETLPTCLDGFSPWINTALKTDIGLMPDGKLSISGYVVELYYEEGVILPVATSISAFVEAYMRLSLTYDYSARNRRYGALNFSEADISFLKSQDGILFVPGGAEAISSGIDVMSLF